MGVCQQGHGVLSRTLLFELWIMCQARHRCWPRDAQFCFHCSRPRSCTVRWSGPNPTLTPRTPPGQLPLIRPMSGCQFLDPQLALSAQPFTAVPAVFRCHAASRRCCRQHHSREQQHISKGFWAQKQRNATTRTTSSRRGRVMRHVARSVCRAAPRERVVAARDRP